MINSLITGLVAIIGTNGITQLFKSFQMKYGDTKIHLFAFVVALAISCGYSVIMSSPGLMLLAKHVGIIFAGSITMYELLWKQLGTVISTPSLPTTGTPQ